MKITDLLKRYSLVICYHLHALVVDTMVLHYRLTEESPVGTTLAVLKTEEEFKSAHSQRQLHEMTFAFLDRSEEGVKYFSLDDTSGTLATSRRVDRESICPSRNECRLVFTVATQPISYLSVIKLSVEIVDINDDRPAFSQAHFAVALSEASPRGSRVALGTAVDRDAPVHGLVGYVMVPSTGRDGDDDDEVFKLRYHINRPSGDGNPLEDESESEREFLELELVGTLDREVLDFYSFVVVAFDDETTFEKFLRADDLLQSMAVIPAISKLSVEIRVKDVNDHRPLFERRKYEVSVEENLRPGSRIVQVVAHDPDHGDNGRLRYAFADKTRRIYETIFSIGHENGWIKLRNNPNSSHHHHHHHHHHNDTNHHHRSSSSSDGGIRRDVLDRETNAEVVLEVIASDHGEGESFDVTVVTIQILDVNDNEPEIRFDPEVDRSSSCCWSVAEDQARDTRIATVSLYDADLNPPHSIACNLTYDFTSTNRKREFGLVKLRDREYFVVLTGRLDREETPTHHVTVVCRDGGDPPLTSARDVIISVDDVNDNEPRFPGQVLVFDVSESSRPFEILFKVEASDDDIGLNGEVRYEMKTRQKSFEIDSHSGAVWSTVNLDRERKSEYKLRVMAEDFGDPRRRSTCQVRVNLLDENDEKPRFHEPSMNVHVQENLSPGSTIGRVEAFDADLPPYNALFYELQLVVEPQPSSPLISPFDPSHVATGTDVLPFAINSTTGEISLISHLDRETTSKYRMNAFAKDLNDPQMYDVTVVTVDVTDVNDNPPLVQFPTERNFTVHLSEFLETDQFLAEIRATDADEGLNSKLKFKIEGVYSTSSYDQDIRQDDQNHNNNNNNNNNNNASKASGIKAMVDEFWRRNEGAWKAPEVVPKTIARHFHIDRTSGRLYSRNSRILVESTRSQGNEDPTLCFFIALSVADHGQPALESRCVLLLVAGGNSRCFDNDSIVEAAGGNLTSRGSETPSTGSNWNRWFWMALTSTLGSILVACCLVFLLLVLVTRCSQRSRTGRSRARNEAMKMKTRTTTTMTMMKTTEGEDSRGGRTPLALEDGGSESLTSSRRPPSLLSKRKMSIRTSSTSSDINRPEPALYFDQMRTSDYFFPSLEMETESMDFIDDSDSSNDHSNRETLPNECKWVTISSGSSKLAQLSLWANNSEKINSQLDSDRDFHELNLKKSKISSDDTRDMGWNFLSKSSANERDLPSHQGGCRGHPLVSDRRNPLKLPRGVEATAAGQRGFRGDSAQIYQNQYKSGDRSNYDGKLFLSDVDREGIYSGNDTGNKSHNIGISNNNNNSNINDSCNSNGNKLSTFGNVRRTVGRESRPDDANPMMMRMMMMTVSTQSNPSRRFHDNYKGLIYSSSMKSPALSTPMSEPLKKKIILSTRQSRNSELYHL